MTRSNSLLALAVFSLSLAASCSQHDQKPASEKSPQSIGRVTVETVKSAELPDLLEASGTVRSKTSAIVSPRIAGVVSVMSAREGSRVAKGEVLARLDAPENQANAAAAAGGVDDASRALDEAKARKGLAEVQAARYEKLFKGDAVSRQEFEIKTTELELAVQGVARAEARVRQAKQQAKGADAFSDYTRIVAPIAGIVTTRHADLGATLFPGQPLFTIEDERGYQLELAIPESMSMTVKSGSSVDVTIDAISSRFTGKISDIVPSADPASRTFIAKIPIAQKGVKSGMFGRGSIMQGVPKPRITVPAAAVSARGALTFVWTVDAAKIVHMRIVKVGRQFGDRVEILSGLTEGEQIITAAIDKASEGAKVE